MTIVLISFLVLFFLILVMRMPLAFAMGIVGFFGFAILQGLTFDNFSDFRWTAVLTMASNRVVDTVQDYTLSVLPLFILMGNFVTKTGLSKELYNASYAFLGHRKGGLAMSTIVACGGFSAMCGSSLATSATMAKVAMPPMREYGYSNSLATASIAAGGTLGILIPPSVILVIYGLLTESSIRELFAAGVIPGILGILFYMAAVRYAVWRKPSSGPAGKPMTFSERIMTLKSVWAVLVLFAGVMGGIYFGMFTPTEASGIGAAGAFVIGVLRRRLSFAGFLEALIDTTRTTTMLFAIIIGALIFSDFVNRAGLPRELADFVQSLEIAPILVLLIIIGIYILLGMVFESLSMLLLTVPVFFPVVTALGFDPIWFGIVVVVVTEISLITPPIGMNVFVLSSVLKDVDSRTIFKGVTPFWCADIIRLLLIIFVVQISLFLPELLYR